jgi:hypothetical protein
MLIYIVSFKSQLPACIAIHNQCSNTMLAAPVYFCNGTISPKLLDQQIDIGAEVKANFEIDTIKNKFEGVLIFKLKRHIESGDQHNVNTPSTETDKNETTHVHMLVIWEVNGTKSFAHVALIEHTEAFTWDEGRLKKLYNKNHSWLKEYNTTSATWLMNNNTTLKTSFKVGGLKRAPELSISISEEKKSDYAMRPFYINLER